MGHTAPRHSFWKNQSLASKLMNQNKECKAEQLCEIRPQNRMLVLTILKESNII